MSVLEIWGAEYQENNALLIKPESTEVFLAMAKRENCPASLLGKVLVGGRYYNYTVFRRLLFGFLLRHLRAFLFSLSAYVGRSTPQGRSGRSSHRIAVIVVVARRDWRRRCRCSCRFFFLSPVRFGPDDGM